MKTRSRGAAIWIAIAGVLLGLPAPGAPAAGPTPAGDAWDGEAVDLSTGLFVHHRTDLSLADGVPVAFVRTHRAGASGGFGVGGAHAHEIRLTTAPPYRQADVLLADANVIRYVRVTPGDDLPGAVFAHEGTPTVFHGSTIASRLPVPGWRLRTADGTFYDFDQQGRLERLTDAFGRVSEILRAVNPLGPGTEVITRITSSSGRWIALAYDAGNRIVQARDTGGGRIVSYAYDALGRLIAVTDPEGGTTRYTYDRANRLLTVEDPRGIVRLTNGYDADGRVIRQTLADQASYAFAYTLDGGSRVIRAEVTDPRGAVRRVTFDPNGYRLSDTRALGTPVERTTTYERDGSGLLLSTTDALGRRTTFTYDARGNVTSVTRAAGSAEAATTALGYAAAGSLGIPRVASITDPLGRVTAFAHDARGFPVEMVDPLGLRTRLVGAEGALLQVGDPLGNATAFAYAAGNVVAITDPLGRVTGRGHDASGRLISETDPLGKQVTLAYDRCDRVTRVTDPAGTTRLSYDPGGNLLTVTDARGGVTRYAYDDMSRLASRTDPLGRSETYSYDAKGNLTARTDRKGQTTAFTYDALDRLVTTTYADGSTTGYVWDAGDRLVQVADSIAGEITRAYDLRDQLVSERTPRGTVRHAYDAAGRRAATSVDGEPAVGYEYDAAGRLTRVSRGGDVVDASYDGAGRLTALTLPNGIAAEYTYDAASQLTALAYRRSGSVLGTLTYAYDAAGRRVRAGGTWARTRLPEPVAAAVHDAANRLVAFGDRTPAHDPNGNLVSDGANTYTWNARDQLVAIDGAGVMADFGYDALGRRESRNVDGVSTWFVHEGADPVQEIGSAGAVDLLGVLDRPLIRWDAGGSLALLTDALASVIALADETGALLTEYAYEPFGAAGGAGALDLNPYQFAGQENDGTGLHFHLTRYYHPALHRFLSEDPAGFAGGDVNLYAFARNDPVSLTYRVRGAAVLPGARGASAVAVDTAPWERAIRVPGSPEQDRALRHPVVAASVLRTGGFPVPTAWTPDRLVTGPPRIAGHAAEAAPPTRWSIHLPAHRPPYRIEAR